MNPDMVRAILQFMSRVQLNAQEIPAYQACVEELSKMLPQAQVAVDNTGGDFGDGTKVG